MSFQSTYDFAINLKTKNKDVPIKEVLKSQLRFCSKQLFLNGIISTNQLYAINEKITEQ